MLNWSVVMAKVKDLGKASDLMAGYMLSLFAAKQILVISHSVHQSQRFTSVEQPKVQTFTFESHMGVECTECSF